MIDNSLDALVADLDRAAERVSAGTERIVNRAGLNMKRDWAHRWTGLRGLQHIGRSIDYDVDEISKTSYEVVVGPNKARSQGPLGNIVEFGSSEHPPIEPAGEQVLKTEADTLERVLGDLGAAL